MGKKTKACPYCGLIIAESAFICTGCGKQQGDVTLAGREPRRVIAFIGLALLLAGGVWTVLAESAAGNILFVVGGLILIYALIAGHVRLSR